MGTYILQALLLQDGEQETGHSVVAVGGHGFDGQQAERRWLERWQVAGIGARWTSQLYSRAPGGKRIDQARWCESESRPE